MAVDEKWPTMTDDERIVARQVMRRMTPVTSGTEEDWALFRPT
jgi:hypothetical protein